MISIDRCYYHIAEKFGQFGELSMIRQTESIQTNNILLAELLICQTFFRQIPPLPPPNFPTVQYIITIKSTTKHHYHSCRISCVCTSIKSLISHHKHGYSYADAKLNIFAKQLRKTHIYEHFLLLMYTSCICTLAVNPR